MGAEDSNRPALDGLKSKISFMPHLIEVIKRCSEPTRKEIKQELLDYLDEMQQKNEEIQDGSNQ